MFGKADFAHSKFQGLYEDLNVRISAGTSSHSALTLTERGFKRLDAFKGYGDHFVHLKIKVPTYLTQEQKELITDFAYLETNTPGTISGIDRSRPRPASQHRQSESTSHQPGVGERYPEYAYEEDKREKPSGDENEGFFTKLKRKLLG